MDSDQGSEREGLNFFGIRSLWTILGYHCSEFVFNEQFLRETQMRFITCIVRERQLWLFGHVAHFPDADPAHQILSARESHEWRRPTGNLMVAAGRSASQGDGDGPGICLRDGQTEAPGVPTESGHSDELLQHMLLYPTCPDYWIVRKIPYGSLLTFRLG